MTPDGQQMSVPIPDGVAPGGQFQVQYQPVQAMAVAQPAQVVMGTAPAMVAPMVAPQPQQVQMMQPALVWAVSIPRAPGQKLGLDLVDMGGPAVVVQKVHEGYAVDAWRAWASRSGESLEVGDEVIQVGETAVAGMGKDAVYALIAQIPHGAPVNLTLKRAPLIHLGPPPPRGCPPGGVWKDERYCGPGTCVVALFVCPLYALCAPCFPLDMRRVYALPDGTKFDVNGKEIVDEGGSDDGPRHESN